MKEYGVGVHVADYCVGISETAEGLKKQIDKSTRVHKEMESDSEREKMRRSCVSKIR